jgi:hypothetical protein
MTLTDEDRMLRRAIVAASSLKLAASLLGWPYSRLTERMRRKNKAPRRQCLGERTPAAADWRGPRPWHVQDTGRSHAHRGRTQQGFCSPA